jgi:hypothetical protein
MELIIFAIDNSRTVSFPHYTKETTTEEKQNTNNMTADLDKVLQRNVSF